MFLIKWIHFVIFVDDIFNSLIVHRLLSIVFLTLLVVSCITLFTWVAFVAFNNFF